MIVRQMIESDYCEVVQVIDRWWGGPTRDLAHPVFFHELGDDALVVESEGVLVGVLFAFINSVKGYGYIHLVGVHPDWRRRGIAKILYDGFEQRAWERGCTELRAITMPSNDASVQFHKRSGWAVVMAEDYAGPSRPRVVMTRSIPAGGPQ